MNPRAIWCSICLLSVAALAAPVPPPGSCPGGYALAGFDLSVEGPGESEPMPLRAVTRLDGGARLIYRPGEIFGQANGEAQVAVISIPTTPSGVLGILEAHKASEPAEWIVPSRAAAVALVYGPQGLSLPKLSELMERDSQLIPQLALYAEKSAQTELLMETVASWERSGAGPGLEAALQGFSSRYGVALPALNRSASVDQQALNLMRALHPALATLDPLAPASSQRLQQSTGLAAAVGGLFFGNTVGLATAGGAMFLNLRSLFFPGSEFRSALTQQVGEVSVLCAKREAVKSRTRFVYLWAWRIQGPPPPRLEGLPLRVNRGEPSILPVKGTNLPSIRGLAAAPAEAKFLAGQSAIELKLPPSAKKGDRIELRIEVEDSPSPIVLPGAIEVLDPRPAITGVRMSLPRELPVALKEAELPANAFSAASIRSEGAGLLPTVHVECTDPSLTLKKLSLRPGEQAGSARVRLAGGAGVLHLSFDPGSIGLPPCTLAARIETSDGVSDPHTIGRLVRLPNIERFTLTGELVATGVYSGWIEGEELESIEKTGWNDEHGVAVSDPPLPVANQGSRQRLRIAMPWPPPAPRAPLFVWLRGEEKGRRTVAVY